MVPSKPEIRVITLEDNSWAYTDVPYRALRSHVEEHLKALYPWVRDTRKNLMIRKYKIEVSESILIFSSFILTFPLDFTERRSPHMGSEEVTGCKLPLKLLSLNSVRIMATSSADQPTGCGTEPCSHEPEGEDL